MQVNGYDTTGRNKRPTVLSPVALDVWFYNGGILSNPFAISAVSIFALSATGSPSAILGSSNLIADDVVPLMNFANSSIQTTNQIFDASNYVPGANASGIYKLGTGHYVVVLDGSLALSGAFRNQEIANTASTVGDYVDVWTVSWTSTSSFNCLINDFRLYNDSFFVVTEPLLLTTRNFLNPKNVKFGSKIDLKVGTEVTIGNQNIDAATRNIFRDTVILNPQFKILKINEGVQNLAGHVEVSGFTDTSALVDVTIDNTMVFNFDTSQLPLHDEVLAGTFGSLTGVYAVQAKYTVINQTIITPLMYFNIT